MIWGCIFGVPFGLLQILLAGSTARLGIDSLDAFAMFLAYLLLGATLGALAALCYEETINRWLTPRVHVARGQLKMFVVGPLVGIILLGAGTPAILAGIFALFVNAAILSMKIRTAVVWDMIVSAAGLGGWYVILMILIGVRAAGQVGTWVTIGTPSGLTLAGLPIEDVILAGIVGALLGPLFAATKQYRHPTRLHTVGVQNAKLFSGLTIVLLAVAGMGWVTNAYILPPQHVDVQPAPGEIEVPTDSDLIFRFDRPINRDQLRLTIEPPVEGDWLYADSITTKHGYRVARFHPSVTLDPGTRYRVELDGISSVWGVPVKPIEYMFGTRVVPDILALQADIEEPQAVLPTAVLTMKPCEAILVTLSAPPDPAVTMEFSMSPTVAFTTEELTEDAGYRIRPSACLTPGTAYDLRAIRQIVRRDRETNEIIAVDDPQEILSAVVQTTGQRPTIETSAVLGATVDMLELRPTVKRTIIPIPMDFQDRALSCEAAALKMALAGKGVKVSERTIMKKIGYDPTPRRKGVWGNPDWKFVGNIDGRQNSTGYGVHWKPIAKAARNWRRSYTFQNGTPEYVAGQIAKGNPVVIWGTLGRAWRDDWKTREGYPILAWKGEHARTVIGFYGEPEAPTHFVINDPIVGRIVWTRAALLQNWSRFNNSGVVVE